MYDSPPNVDDAQLAGEEGFALSLDMPTRDAEDTAFETDPFELRISDGDEDDMPFEARGVLVFEPAVVGGVEDNWQVCIDIYDDFLSDDGTWPDTFSTVEEALECYRGYFEPGGIVERCGYELV